ncbi:MAG TPA: pilus assembly protein PilM [Sedimentisphaerales bacterium]|nr:pilus assembly protein PilM [Sedimentisphaerales bacterium]
MLNKLLDLDRYYTIGLDVGSSAVKMVQVTRNGHGLVVNAAASQDFEITAEDDDVAIKTKAVAAIKTCYKRLGLKVNARHAVCGVSGPEVATRSFSLPAVEPERLQTVIMAEAAEVCPFNVRQNRFCYQLVAPGAYAGDQTQESGKERTGIIAAATNMVVSEKRRIVESAGLHCAIIDVNGLAMANLFNECEKQPAGRTIVLVNVRNSWVNMAIISDTALPFIRDLNHGGRNIVASIAQERGLTEAIVRDVMRNRNDNAEMKLAVSQGMINACGRLARDISETLRFHMTQEHSGPVEAVYVCGGFAPAEGFVSALSSLLNQQVKLWNPFKQMKRSNDAAGLGSLLEERGSAFVVAAGLGMRSI